MREIKESEINVYIIDDDELHLKILKSKFETSTQYNVSTYTTGEDFLYSILTNPVNKKQVHIVLLDYLLKSSDGDANKNGNEILQVIKSNYPELEVIMLSGVEDVDVATSAMQMGAVTFVKKNENSFLRINNSIKWIVSEKDLAKKKRSSFQTLYLFLSVAVGLVLIIGLIYKYFPKLLNF